MTVHFTCQQQRALVTAYLDDVLPSATVAQFDAHVANCDGCRIHLDEVRQRIAVTGALSADDIDETTMGRLLVTFRNWRAQPSTRDVTPAGIRSSATTHAQPSSGYPLPPVRHRRTPRR